MFSNIIAFTILIFGSLIVEEAFSCHPVSHPSVDFLPPPPFETNLECESNPPIQYPCSDLGWQHEFRRRRRRMVGKSCLRTGTFQLTPTCTCEGMELPGYGSGPRLFKVECRNNQETLGCTYHGNPHHCRQYNNNGQEQFYKEMLNSIERKMCQLPYGNCPNRNLGYFAPMCEHCSRANFMFHSRN